MADYDSDVIVVGGGLAGICSAIELLDRNLQVTILDRDCEQNFGGLAKESFGGIFVVGSPEQKRVGAIDSPELALADWNSFAEFEPGDIWPRRWAETFVHRSLDDIYQWLRVRGVTFLPIPHWAERGQFTPGNSLPRFHVILGTGRELVLQLCRRLLQHQGRNRLQIRFGHRVDELTTKNRAISGCHGVIEATGAAFAAKCECVIVTAGGINGNLDLVRRHWPKELGSPPSTILNGSHVFADGRMHDAVLGVGGNITHLDKMWNYAAGVHHPWPRKPHHGLSLVPPRSALWMNWRGERIGPQPLVNGFDTRDLVTNICRQERQYSWQIMNTKIAVKELAVSGAEFNHSLREKKRFSFIRDILVGNRQLLDDMIVHCEDFVVADSVRELAERMNVLQGDNVVDGEKLESAIEAYDARVIRGGAFQNDEQLRRISICANIGGIVCGPPNHKLSSIPRRDRLLLSANLFSVVKAWVASKPTYTAGC